MGKQEPSQTQNIFTGAQQVFSTAVKRVEADLKMLEQSFAGIQDAVQSVQPMSVGLLNDLSIPVLPIVGIDRSAAVSPDLGRAADLEESMMQMPGQADKNPVNLPVGTILASVIPLDALVKATSNSKAISGGDMESAAQPYWILADGRPIPGSAHALLAKTDHAPDLRNVLLLTAPAAPTNIDQNSQPGRQQLDAFAPGAGQVPMPASSPLSAMTDQIANAIIAALDAVLDTFGALLALAKSISFSPAAPYASAISQQAKTLALTTIRAGAAIDNVRTTAEFAAAAPEPTTRHAYTAISTSEMNATRALIMQADDAATQIGILLMSAMAATQEPALQASIMEAFKQTQETQKLVAVGALASMAAANTAPPISQLLSDPAADAGENSKIRPGNPPVDCTVYYYIRIN